MRRTLDTAGRERTNSSWSFSTASNSSKEAIRSQISAQVEEFLRHGGQIRVVDTGASANTVESRVTRNIGSVWHGQDELQSFID